MSIVPELDIFRKAVDGISKRRDATLIKTLYLTAGRVSELVTKATPYDSEHKSTKPYGLHLTWELKDFKKEKVLLIKTAVAKRSSKNLVFKVIALPCNPKYEPWTLDLLKHIVEHKELKFPITRFRAYQVVREWLWEKAGLEIFKPKLKPKKDEGEQRYLNPWRHIRISHLAEYYDFEAFDLTVYAGWTFKTGLGKIGMGSGQLDTYLHLKWKRYFPKLLKPIGNLV